MHTVWMHGSYGNSNICKKLQRSSNLSSIPRRFPSGDFAKLSKSPKSVFWNNKTGQTIPSCKISQHIPSRLTIYGWSRMEGWVNMVISVRMVVKASSSGSWWLRSGRKSLKANLSSELTRDSLILAVCPCPISPLAASHVEVQNQVVVFELR